MCNLIYEIVFNLFFIIIFLMFNSSFCFILGQSRIKTNEQFQLVV